MTRYAPFAVLLTVVVSLALLSACAEYGGRIMDEGEDDLVGAKQAGTAAYTRLIDEAVTKLLTRQGGEIAVPNTKVTFVGLENLSAENLGDWGAQIERTISASIENTDRYRLVSRRFVEAALRELRFRPDELVVPEKRRQFSRLLERDGNPVDFLLFAELSSGTTTGVDVKQRDYILGLELVNVETGDTDEATARIRKEYVR